MATRGRGDFVKFYLAPPKMRVAPQMPPPNSETWRRHWTNLFSFLIFQNITMQFTSKQATDRHMNKTVITIILVSLACYLPQFFALVSSVHERTVWHTRFVIPWVYIVTFLTAALNPFVYCWKNRRLRSEMLKFTTRLFLSNQRTSENVISITSSAPISNTTKV